DEIVGIHDGTDMSLFDSTFEGGQIDLAHGALIDLRVSVVAVVFGVVAHVVLDGRDYTLTLHSANVGYGNARSQKWIFAKIFEVPSIHRSAMDVDSRTKQKMHSARARILTKDFGHPLHQIRIPGGRETDTTHCRGRSIITHADWTIRHLLLWQSEIFVAADVEALDPAEQINFLLQRHA